MKLTALTMNPDHGNAKHEHVEIDHHGLRIDSGGNLNFVIRLRAEDDKSAVLTFESREEFSEFQGIVNQLGRLVNIEKVQLTNGGEPATILA